MFIGVIIDTGIVEQTEPELVIKVDSDLADEIKIESYVAIDGRVLRVSSKEDKVLPNLTCKVSQYFFYKITRSLNTSYARLDFCQ